MTLDNLLSETEKMMEDTLRHLRSELLKIRTGKAYPEMVRGIMVNYYGVPTPIEQVSNIAAADSRTLSIQPWDKGVIKEIEKAIIEANLGFNPMNDGEFIRIPIPPLTEERRKDLVRQAKAQGEDSKVSIRSSRKEAMDQIKQGVKEGLSEDQGKRLEDKVEDIVKSFYKQIDQMIEVKQEDIMTI